MRLIDADELIKRIGKWMPKDPCGREQTVEEIVATDIAASVCMEIEEMPTAFDKEKVINKLKRLESNSFGYYNQYDDEQAFGESAAYRVSIEIVEKGGVD